MSGISGEKGGGGGEGGHRKHLTKSNEGKELGLFTVQGPGFCWRVVKDQYTVLYDVSLRCKYWLGA